MNLYKENTAIDLWEYLIRESRTDSRTFMESLFFDEKSKGVLLGKVHDELHNFILSNQFGVVELHRECGKTTNMIAFIAWLIGNNPNIRIKVISNSDTVAVSRGKAIREIVESARYREIFPHVHQGREWTDKKFTINRTIITPESTLECHGVYSKTTGGRCDWMFFDDVDDEEVIVSEVKRTRNTERVLNVWLNFLPPDGRAFAFATPWHEADTCAKLKGNGWPSFRKPILNMTPVWPERWGRKELMARKARIGSLAFARGFELVPITSETAPIKGPWFRYWEKLPRLTNIAIVVDPNNSLDDKADYTAIGLLGVDWDFKVYLLELIRAHYEFPGLIKDVIKMAETSERNYKMTPYIAVEDTAYQKAIPQQLRIESRFPIIGIKADKSKFIRASRLAVHIENGRVYLRGSAGSVDPSQKIVYDECISFPASATVDCVDMLGYGVEFMLRMARKSGASAS